MQVESEPAKDKIMNTILTSDRIEIVIACVMTSKVISASI